MKKLVKRVWFCFLLVVLVWCGTLLADRQMLRQELVRFHVVAASDEAEDQILKLRVRDAVMDSLHSALADVGDVEQAKTWLRENLPKLQRIANETLAAAGCEDFAAVRFDLEVFDTRQSDGLSLPAGVYETLRITIGEGEGENWWCVVFPLQSADESEDIAAGAGFPGGLDETLTEAEGFSIRFFLLDALGRLEYFLFGG